MLLVGLTGGIGSGKSTVSSMLAGRGAVVVDADAIVREVQAPAGPAYAGIVERFGPGVVGPDGALDRRAIAAVVFEDASARADLGALTYPHVARLMGERVAAQRDTDNVVVLDIPLLAERGRDTYGVAAVIVVDCPVDVAVARLVNGRGFTEEEARARIAAQSSREERIAIADRVIDNSGGIDHLIDQVEGCWAWLLGLRDGAGAGDGAGA